MALHGLFTGTSKTYWHSMPYLPALHMCVILTGTAFITTGIPSIHIQLLNNHLSKSDKINGTPVNQCKYKIATWVNYSH